MKKILFITYTYSKGGGSENVLTTLVNHLDSAQYKIDIIEINQFLVKKEPYNHNICLLKPMVKANDKKNNLVISYILHKKPEIIKPLFRLYDYDIIITWNYQLPSFCLHSFKNEVKIAWCHESMYDLSPETYNSTPEYRNEQLLAWKNADRIVTVSNKPFRLLKNTFPELEAKIEIINNGIDIKRIQELSLEKINIDIPDINNIIVAAGRLDKNKNFELLIYAVSRVIHTGTDCLLIILGEGELLSELEDIVLKENIKDNVIFTGYKQNPYPFFRLSKILCLSSDLELESWGMVLLEGMSLGKPFVTTPIAGASEELSDNERCGLVSDWDIDEYADCIKKLLNNQNIYNEMSKNCIERANEFSIENMVAKFYSLMDKLNFTHVTDNNLIYKNKNIERIYAISYYALVYSLTNQFYRIYNSWYRYKNELTFLNFIKLFFRFGMLLLSVFVFPVIFLYSFLYGIFK